MNPSSHSPQPSPEREQRPVEETSSTGLDANIAGTLSYVLGFVSGIAFLVLEKESTFVRFHAFQSTVTFLSLFALQAISGWIPLIGGLLGAVIPLGSLILWIILMAKAYQGERYQLPIVGEIAEERANNPR